MTCESERCCFPLVCCSWLSFPFSDQIWRFLPEMIWLSIDFLAGPVLSPTNRGQSPAWTLLASILWFCRCGGPIDPEMPPRKRYTRSFLQSPSQHRAARRLTVADHIL